MSKTGVLKTDQLFKGLTRPPMLLGVSFNFFALNFVITAITYILSESFMVLLGVGPVIHTIGYIVCAKEPLLIELFMIRAQKCNRCKNKLFHGANSYDMS